MPNRDVYSNKTATIRDFSGGWNVADSQYNLSSKFLPISDNIVVGVDGALSPRYGYRLYKDLRSGTVVNFADQSVSVIATNASAIIRITWNAHPLNTGDHITITARSGTVLPGTVPAILGTYGVIKIDANNFEIITRVAAVATVTTAGVLLTGTRDTHVLAGDIVDQTYFQGNLVLFDHIGEIVAINTTTNTVTRIWDIALARATVGAPLGWRMAIGEKPLQLFAFDTFKQTLIVANGRDNDKPIEINFNRTAGAVTQFLVDPATTSNANVYAADFILSFDGYVLLGASMNTTTLSTNNLTTVDISAAGTSGVFIGNPAPDDAVQLDLGRVTQTLEPRITGLANIRGNVFIGFYDTAMLGKLGIYSGTLHEPEFKDQVPQHGALNQRVIMNIGNDLLMCDYAGVPAFSQSQMSGTIVPERLSQLIDPELNKHLARLSDNTLRYKVWAMFNVRDRMYMLFLPKHDSKSVFTTGTNPLYVMSDFYQDKLVLVNAPGHTISAGDYVDVSGATNITGLTADNINGRRRVAFVVTSDYFYLEVGDIPTTPNVSGGGTITFAPVDDETICYAYQYNPMLRIKRWTRLRGWYFSSGCVSKDGTVFVAHQSKVWILGTQDRPIYADKADEYDVTSILAGWPVEINTRVKDLTTGKIWVCLNGHIPLTSSIATEVANRPDRWDEYFGFPIDWAAEGPWSDLSDRLAVKIGQQILFDVQGSDRFSFQLFVDNVYDDKATYKISPASSTQMAATVVGLDATGFGGGTQPYGLGNRAKEQFLYHFPWRGKLVKMRFQGSTTRALRIVSVSLMYQKGSIYR